MTRMLALALLAVLVAPPAFADDAVDAEEAQYQKDLADSEKPSVKSKFSCILKDGLWQPQRNATVGSTNAQKRGALSQPVRWNAITKVNALTDVKAFMRLMNHPWNDRGSCRAYPNNREGVEQATRDMEQFNRFGKIWVDKGIIPQ